MAIRIRNIAKIVASSGLKFLVHGPAGAGKTVLSATTGEPTLILSAESGLLSIKDAPTYIKGTEIESIQDLRDIYDYLVDQLKEEDGPRFRWIVLDSITEIAEQVLTKEKSEEKDPRKAYMTMQDEIMKIFRLYRDLDFYHVVFTSKQERIDDDGRKMFVPMMPGQKLAQQIPYLFDMVFALRVEEDKEKKEIYRVLQTCRDGKYEAKDRSGKLKLFESPNLAKIAKKILAVPVAEDEKPAPEDGEKKPDSDAVEVKDSPAVDVEKVEKNVVEVDNDEKLNEPAEVEIDE